MSKWSAVVNKLGETIMLNNQYIKASLKQSTKATYSLANRAFYIEGQCVKGYPEIKAGDYFTRLIDNTKYMVVSSTAEGLADDICYIYAAQCNVQISIARQSQTEIENELGERIKPFNIVYSEVDAFRETETRSYKTTNDGLIDQTIYTLMLPHKYLLSEGDRVIMKSNVDGEFKNVNYRVESISNAVVGLDGNGIDVAQLSFDVRG